MTVAFQIAQAAVDATCTNTATTSSNREIAWMSTFEYHHELISFRFPDPFLRYFKKMMDHDSQTVFK